MTDYQGKLFTEEDSGLVGATVSASTTTHTGQLIPLDTPKTLLSGRPVLAPKGHYGVLYELELESEDE